MRPFYSPVRSQINGNLLRILIQLQVSENISNNLQNRMLETCAVWLNLVLWNCFLFGVAFKQQVAVKWRTTTKVNKQSDDMVQYAQWSEEAPANSKNVPVCWVYYYHFLLSL